MEATYRAFNGRLIVKIDGSNVKELIEGISSVAEVFDADGACGKCKSEAIYPKVRTAKGYDFYELQCAECGARLSFGQSKEGGVLFAKRDEHPDTRGWYVYRAIEASRDSGPPQSAPRHAQASDSPGLLEYLRRAKHESTTVFGELCERIRASKGDQMTDSTWTVALMTCGEPGPENNAAIVRFLYREVEKL